MKFSYSFLPLIFSIVLLSACKKSTDDAPGPSPTGATVTTLTGTTAGGFSDGTTATAAFQDPSGIAVDAAGNIYVSDTDNNRIRKITPDGTVTTLAGSSTSGSDNGTGANASFFQQMGIAVDLSGNVYVADFYNNLIRKVTSAGVVTTLAGSGTYAFAEGTGIAASFKAPSAVTVDRQGNVFVCDTENNRIRKITSAGAVTTFAGSGASGADNGTGTAATFYLPQGIVIDAKGTLYVSEQGNNLIRQITSAGVVTTIAGTGSAGHADGIGTSASFSIPNGLAIDSTGNLYVADMWNHMIRKVVISTGVVSTIAGSTNYGAVNSKGVSASFRDPAAVALDASGNIYVADYANNLIRKIAK